MNIIITGSSKGIGRTIAEKFAADGHHLFLCARDENKLQQAANELQRQFPATVVHTMPADLSKKEEVTAFAAFCLKAGTPDVLINNTGVYLPGNIAGEPEGNLEQMMATNLYSAYHLTRAILPAMKKKQQGHIFNICSIASLNAYDGGGSYSISKFALDGFNKNLRHELKPTGIKVTGIYPGAVLTDSWAGFDNSNRRIMEAGDVAMMVHAATMLSGQAVVEDIVLRPQLGDL